MYHNFCIHSSVEGDLGCFLLLVIIDKVAINMLEHVSLLSVGPYSEYISRSGIVESSDRTISNFLKTFQTYFQSSSCISLQSHQQRKSVPFPPHPCHLWWVFLFVCLLVCFCFCFVFYLSYSDWK